METYWKLNPDVVFVIPTVAMSINPEKGLWLELAWLGLAVGVTCK
jgi:hypothetical protein